MASFKGKTALITGAASGIGRAVAEHLALQGAKRLILVDRDGDALERLMLPPCETTLGFGDVREETLWDAIEPELGQLDHAVIMPASPARRPLPIMISISGATSCRSISTAPSCRCVPPCGRCGPTPGGAVAASC